jgi:MFS family permease
VLALSLLPAAFGIGGLALVGVLLASTATRAVVSTVAYPLATESAAGAELPEGVVIGLLNGAWAAGLVLAPLLAGAIDQVAGSAAGYLTAVVPGSIGAVWLLARANTLPAVTGCDPAVTERDPAAAPASASEAPTADHELAVAT